MLLKILKWIAVTLVIAIVGLYTGFLTVGPTVKGPLLDFLTGSQAETPNTEIVQSRFKVPAGLRVGVFAEKVDNARMMVVTRRDDIIVSSFRQGEVILLHKDRDKDGRADGRTVLASGLDVPHGLALRDGYLYIAETHRIIRAPYDDARRSLGDIESVYDGLPPGGNHRTRTIGFGPDGNLYVTIGSSCNVCIEERAERATIMRMTPEGEAAEIYATGLRNTVGFDWQPGTGRLYGTDNARDLLGDEIPNDELNLIERGADYGWPHAFDIRVPDPEFGIGLEGKVQSSRPYAHGFGGHRAPLGIRFLREDFALVALHGSWNRSQLAGYKVVGLVFGDDGITEIDFMTGFEVDDDVIGRPVDIASDSTGAIYISDDYAGVIYKIGDENQAIAGFVPDVSSINAEKPSMAKALGLEQDGGLTPEAGLGALLFATNGCASCHIDQGDGVAIRELRGLAKRYDVDDLMALLNTPPSPMPRPELNDEQRRALSLYLLAVAP